MRTCIVLAIIRIEMGTPNNAYALVCSMCVCVKYLICVCEEIVTPVVSQCPSYM